MEIIKVIKNPGNYCNKDWKEEDILEYIGTAHDLGYWTEDDEPDVDMYKNKRTCETINLTLLQDKGNDYFKIIK